MLPDRIRRGDNRRHRKFAEEVFRIRYVAHDHVALHRHVSHDQPPLAKRGEGSAEKRQCRSSRNAASPRMQKHSPTSCPPKEPLDAAPASVGDHAKNNETDHGQFKKKMRRMRKRRVYAATRIVTKVPICKADRRKAARDGMLPIQPAMFEKTAVPVSSSLPLPDPTSGP